LEAAEMAKLVNNTFRDLQFAFANEIGSLCDRLGISAREVIKAANKDYSRSNISLPGLTAGPCLEKDPWILHNAGAKAGLEMDVTRSGRIVNEGTVETSIIHLMNTLPTLKPERILIAGVAFKGRPETNDTRGSLAFNLIRTCQGRFPGARVFTLDPLVKSDEISTDLAQNHFTELVEESEAFDLLIIQHNGESLISAIKAKSGLFGGSVVLDFWDTDIFSDTVENPNYICVGGRSA
jgi:nucleotide sugar dehydrogenase